MIFVRCFARLDTGFRVFFWGFASLIWVDRVLLGFTGFYWVLMGSERWLSDCYRFSLGFTGFHGVLSGFVWVLLGFTGLLLVLLGFNQVSPGFTEFY